MILFSQLASIALIGVLITIIFTSIGDQLAYFIRGAFTFPNVNLGWDPTAGMSPSWRRRRSPDLNASDWAGRVFDD